jgi:hypothetical protein
MQTGKYSEAEALGLCNRECRYAICGIPRSETTTATPVCLTKSTKRQQLAADTDYRQAARFKDADIQIF